MNDNKLEKSKAEQQTMKPLLKSVHCNYLPVTDLKRAADWWEEYLGLKRFKPDGSILILGNGQWLFLLESKSKTNANFTTDLWEGENYEMFSLTFEVDDIVKVHKSLQESGAEVYRLEDRDRCGLQFTFKDLDGNKFNVWQDVK
jgi:predicted enzyme related to lactoylglutathione lyase